MLTGTLGSGYCHYPLSQVRGLWTQQVENLSEITEQNKAGPGHFLGRQVPRPLFSLAHHLCVTHGRAPVPVAEFTLTTVC